MKIDPLTWVVAGQTLVLAITAALVWRYTSETARLRQEMVRQNKLALRPIVLPQFPEIAPVVRLTNHGAGCAVNIQVSTLRTDQSAAGFGLVETRFDPVVYLPSGDGVVMEWSMWADGQRLHGSPFDNWFLPRYPGAETMMEITFGDVEGRAYRIRVTIAEESNVNKLPRKVTIGRIEEL